MAAEPLTSTELVTGLLSLFGAGGFTTIVVGLIAYKTEALKGRREPMKAENLPAPGAFPGSHDFELLANATTQLASAIQQQTLLLEYRHVECAGSQEAFQKWREAREMQATLAAFKAERAGKKPG